ncbi:MAG: MotA/TolQ/ExbB proton channel family protein [Candidatus Babeliales bacterium]|jgi:biopolymer transport protein TolQ
MEFTFFKGALWQLIRQMDWVAILILIGLFCLSIVCIAIVAFKYVSFHTQRRRLELLLHRLRSVKNFNEMIVLGREFQESAGGKVIMRGLLEARLLIERNNPTKTDVEVANGHISLTSKDLDDLELALGHAIDAVALEEETYLPILGTSAAASPLIGLFGTIWGLIHAFVDISQEKSADIATVAPGMAEALVVTLAGLLVAIPALVAFHYFSHELRKLEFGLNEIGERFVVVTKQTFVR